jgi:hypothetical protein
VDATTLSPAIGVRLQDFGCAPGIGFLEPPARRRLKFFAWGSCINYA